MGWEVIREENERCPCGEGAYKIIHQSDDWGRYREDWVMECRSCQKDYTLGSDTVFNKGMKEEQYKWVKR